MIQVGRPDADQERQKLYKTRKGKAGGAVFVAIHLPTKPYTPKT